MLLFSKYFVKLILNTKVNSFWEKKERKNHSFVNVNFSNQGPTWALGSSEKQAYAQWWTLGRVWAIASKYLKIFY